MSRQLGRRKADSALLDARDKRHAGKVETVLGQALSAYVIPDRQLAKRGPRVVFSGLCNLRGHNVPAIIVVAQSLSDTISDSSPQI